MNEFNRDERFVISQMFDYFVEALQQNDYRYTREEWGRRVSILQSIADKLGRSDMLEDYDLRFREDIPDY
jgi:hypothetical protein